MTSPRTPLEISYYFKNEDLLREAMTHKSFSVEGHKLTKHNERLEFLGDAILNFVIASDLFQNFRGETEGLLSKKRASLVNQTTLSELAKGLALQDHILFGPGEVKQGSPLNPRILSSTLEALMGAIYLDSDFNTVEAWILNLFKTQMQSQDDVIGNTSDYKSRLQELTQKNKWGTPIYEVVITTGPSHKPHFVISLKLDAVEKVRADGPSKKAAEQKAAELYLNELQKGERP